MKIDGKAIAQGIFQDLQARTATLKEKNITPHIAIILVGDNPASVSYVKRKKIKAEEIGAKATILKYESRIKNQELLKVIEKLNRDETVHGIIVQRPLPPQFDSDTINQAVIPEKDIDAFHANTPYDMPLAKAALMLLEYVHQQLTTKPPFEQWLKSKQVTVIGKGETGGGPIITLLKKYKVHPTIIDSKTKNPQEITKSSDIIISAVGKEKVLTKKMLKKGVILISVGQHKQQDDKFHGDYEEEEIENIASWYSPTPGGVGPVNVASLLQNLLQASEN
jgi:methylenetetrahydrofolate dehydrogenase (NADP+)/methenyltetrahydrofolate cyclohydrolase